jgi:hypothetical protein
VRLPLIISPIARVTLRTLKDRAPKPTSVTLSDAKVTGSERVIQMSLKVT